MGSETRLIQFPSVPLSWGFVVERTGTQSYMTTVIGFRV